MMGTRTRAQSSHVREDAGGARGLGGGGKREISLVEAECGAVEVMGGEL